MLSAAALQLTRRLSALARSMELMMQDSFANPLALLLAEFKRAIAAEQRYEALRRSGGGATGGIDAGRAGIARRIFDEFYCVAVARGRMLVQRPRSDTNARL